MKIDNRTRQDIMDELRALSRSYTPEWKFDTAQPDAASVIGMIFSDQMMENVRKLNQVPDKYHIEFENMYGMSLKPAIPAKTVCTLKVSESIQDGVNVPKGTQVIGMTDSGEEVLFMLTHDINAVSAQLTDIIETSERFSMFPYHNRNQAKNRRQAVLVCFRRLPRPHGQKLRLRFQGNLTDSRMAELFAGQEYFSIAFAMDREGGQTKAAALVRNAGGVVEIDSGEEPPAVSVDGEEMTVIALEMKKTISETIFINQIELFMEQLEIRPDFIWNGRSEVTKECFLPFTEQPALYSECYIGQNFLFGQRSAVVTLCFRLDFERCVPQKAVPLSPDLRIIKRKPPKTNMRPRYECRIQEVTFEYCGSNGWRKLLTDMETAALFSREENAGEYRITFEVPADWESVVQGGYEGKCIRMQIVRADNCYLQDAEYIYPVLSGVRLCMEEQEKGMAPESVTVVCGERTARVEDRTRGGGGFLAFQGRPYQDDYVYWGFDRPFGQGPVSLFVELENPAASGSLEISFAYSSRKGFQPLRVVDDTNSFRNSGILMFAPPADMAACEVEGISRFWLRLAVRANDTDRKNMPVVRNIYMNAVGAENVVIQDEQDYYIDTVTPDMKFPLYSDNILSVQVWVNERGQLSEDERDRLMRGTPNDAPAEIRAEYNFLGEVEDFYVLWHEIDSFENAAPMERCYCVDRGRNELVFGDGVRVKVPQNTGSIAFKTRVVCCDGEKANIRANQIDRFRSAVIAVEEVTNPVDAYGGTNLENVQNALKRGNSILSSRRRMVTEQDYIREALAFSDVIEQASCVTGADSAVRLVLLMKDYQKGDYSFRSVQRSLKEHLAGCCEITCGDDEIQIIPPVFVRISVDVWISVKELSESLEIKQRCLDRITEFLEPVKSADRAGWNIGKLPESRQIRLMLNALEDAVRIEHVNVLAQYSHGQHYYEMSLDRVAVSPLMVCCNGTHRITVVKNC